jgi:hypothetical protein
MEKIIGLPYLYSHARKNIQSILDSLPGTQAYICQNTGLSNATVSRHLDLLMSIDAVHIAEVIKGKTKRTFKYGLGPKPKMVLVPIEYVPHTIWRTPTKQYCTVNKNTRP